VKLLDGWYALHVRSRAEHMVTRYLEEKGYEPFLPLYRARRRRPNRLKDIALPLFPNYVFCRVRAEAVGLIVTTPGVLKIVGAGNVPVPVEDAEVDALRKLMNARVPVEPWPFLHVGQSVEIQAGPLCGVRGVLARVGNSDRLIVSVMLLQRSVSVEIEACHVAPLAPARSVREGTPARERIALA
jgi:transcription termination/antitermination protein NusG